MKARPHLKAFGLFREVEAWVTSMVTLLRLKRTFSPFGSCLHGWANRDRRTWRHECAQVRVPVAPTNNAILVTETTNVISVTISNGGLTNIVVEGARDQRHPLQ
jgi:hypothetical protein